MHVDAADHDLVQSPFLVILRGEIQPRSRVRLRIRINHQHIFLQHRERSGEIDGGRGFSDPSFLIGNSDDFSHI